MRDIAKGPSTCSASGTGNRRAHTRLVLSALAVIALTFALGVSLASASKSVKSFFGAPGTDGGQFGNPPRGVAVNSTGAGGAGIGDIYVADTENSRIERFSASGAFISAWGFDVDKGGGTGYEVCVVAANCKAGINTVTPAPGGELSSPQGIAIDQFDGSVYVTDQAFLRVQKFSATGTFSSAFGKDVIVNGSASDPTSVTATQVCTVASDCQAGVSGSLGGEFKSQFSGHIAIAPHTAPNADNVLVADPANSRVLEFSSAGAFVRTFGFNVAGAGAGTDNTGTGFEVCTQAVAGAANCTAGVAGAGTGQFAASQPTRIAEDSTGAIYTVESTNSGASARRVQKFTPQVGPPPLLPSVFAAASLSVAANNVAPTDVAIGASDRVFVVKQFTAATGTPPATVAERRILEFDSAGVLQDTHLVNAGINSVNGLAVDLASGQLAVSSSTAGASGTKRVYIVDNVAPPTATIDPVTDFDAFGAALEGEVDPNGSRTDYRFEYSSDAGATWVCTVVASCADPANLKDAGAGADPVAVSVHLDLTPDTTYIARLTAIKPFGAGSATSTPTPSFHTPAVPPTVITGAVAPRGTSSARLSGFVNPNNHSTDVHFEYGTVGDCESNPCVSTPLENVGSEFILNGLPYLAITEELTGLQPGTTYHYRLVATNIAGTAKGADRTFTTLSTGQPSCANEEVREQQHSTYLPDCRAFELVNNPDRGNQHAFFAFSESAASEDGKAAFWNVAGGAPGSSTGASSWFVADRTETTPNGWESTALAPPAGQQVGGGSFEYKPAEPAPTTPDFSRFVFVASGKPEAALVRLDREGNQQVLRTYPNGIGIPNDDLTDDAAHVVLINPETDQLEDVGSAPEVLSLMPDDSESECGLEGEGKSFIGSGSGGGAGTHWHAGYQMMDTTDASRVYFQVKPDGECGGSGLLGLYMRNRDANEGAGETLLIDPGVAGHEPEFIRATPDGRSAYFATYSQLDSADENTNGDVYRWDEEAGGSEEYTCLTCEAHPDVDIFDFNGHLTSILVSDDFSHVYFESTKQLVPGRGKAGDVNIYSLSGGAVHFVADMASEGRNLDSSGTAQLSSDGNVLLFGADATLALTTDPISSGAQLYRYDDREGSLECVSCRRSGATSHAFGSKGMSRDGSTIAFTTAEALVPLDVNQDDDVYRWREGTVGLITDGVSDFPDSFLAVPRVAAVDGDGSDIFFTVAAPGLTGFEIDGLGSSYDAKIGGGFEPPTPPSACIADDCQGPLEPVPSLDQSGTSTYSGSGNLTSSPNRRPCAHKKGKAKQRCMRKQRKRLREARAQGGAGRTK